ncbi:Cof-type HAD-IIB family hydrolase [Paenibacillus borealis]|uniref:Haloacid dehalogenase n=1 Tax=Paenibacillus borealis TaxID=160799 RepID=A0A089LFV8_PAEBO|nr:Cof-type HAD-IIB family hydrolase [Paenibacillus borealis]AIQ58028.1 haloacid dehalogenase [Paenibacillus borealis]
MYRKAYVTDLDGTLLNSEQKLTDYTVQVITEAMERGIIISFATARGFISADSVVADISWKYPLILYNGALIYDSMTHKVIAGYWLDPVISGEIITIGRTCGITPFHFLLDAADGERVLYEAPIRTGDVEFYKSRMNDVRFREVKRLDCPPDHRTVVITYIGRLEELAPLHQKVLDRFGSEVHIHFMKDIYIKDHYFLEFSHPDANKSQGLKLWAQHMGLDTADVVVFGDHLNDLGLFAAAGTGVAVENAHEDLKAVAHRITASNNENGVAVFLAETMNKGEMTGE